MRAKKKVLPLPVKHNTIESQNSGTQLLCWGSLKLNSQKGLNTKTAQVKILIFS